MYSGLAASEEQEAIRLARSIDLPLNHAKLLKGHTWEYDAPPILSWDNSYEVRADKLRVEELLHLTLLETSRDRVGAGSGDADHERLKSIVKVSPSNRHWQIP
jgi:hypothetical protein